MEKVNYKGWPNCYRLSNDIVDLVVTTDVGPRIIRFGFVGEHNEFKEYEDMVGQTGGDEWRIYGGHRLWHAPEEQPRTYYPDNGPVQLEQHAGRCASGKRAGGARHTDFVRVIQPTEPTTGIQKEIDIRLSPSQAHVELTHRLRNTNLWTVELAVWALTVMAQGGRSIIPLPPRGSHEESLLPTNTMTMWAYTDLADPRWTWGTKYVMLQQDPSAEKPQKIGVLSPDGWVAYARHGHLFVKKYDYVPGGRYPDFGCSVETFTNADMLEVETLTPLVHLQPGGHGVRSGGIAEHIEHWFLYRDVPVPEDDADVDAHVLPRVM